MSKWFSYTASFKLKVVKYAKKHGNRAAKRHWTSSHRECHQIVETTGRKASLDAKTEEGNARETSTVARGGAGGEDLDSGEDLWDLCFNQDDTRKR